MKLLGLLLLVSVWCQAQVTCNNGVTCNTAGANPVISADYTNLNANLVSKVQPTTLSAGSTITSPPSATLFGFVVPSGSIPSAQVAGGLATDTSGRFLTSDGTNINQYIYVAGSGATPPTAPTSGQLGVWGAGFSHLGLANSSVPNAGELLLTTVPNSSATRSVFGLGSAITGGSTSGTYFNINAATNYAGVYLGLQSNGSTFFRMLRDDMNDLTRLQFGDATNAYTFKANKNNPTGIFGRSDGTSQGTTQFLTDLEINDTSGGANAWVTSILGKTTIYNSIATTGIGTIPTYGTIHQTAQTGAISTATLCLAGTASAGCNAGQYHIHWDFIETGTACSTPGPGGVTFLFTWTDTNGTTHSAVSLGMDDASAINAVSQTFHFQTSLGAAWGSGDFNISTNGGIIQYATGYTACTIGTGTYQLDISASQLQ